MKEWRESKELKECRESEVIPERREQWEQKACAVSEVFPIYF